MNILAGHAILICLISLMQLYQTLAMIMRGREYAVEACLTLRPLLKPTPARATLQESLAKSG
jgi:hypothetical protein